MSDWTRRAFLKGSAAASIAGISGVSGCLGSVGLGGGTPTLTLGWIAPGGLPSPMAVPEIQERLDNLGSAYELETSQVQSTPDGLNKLASGELDTTTAAYSSFPNAVNKGISQTDLTIVGIVGYDAHEDWYKIPWIALKDSGVETTEDLKGKKVGLNGLGTGVHAIAEKQFQNAGIDTEKSIEYVEIPFPAMGSAIRDGKVAAGTVPPAFATAIRAKGGVRTVFDSRDAWGSAYPFVFNVTTAGNIDQKSDAFDAWGSDYVQMIQFMKNNRSTVIPWLSDHFGLPEKVFDAFLFRKNRDWYIPTDAHVDGARLQEVINGLPEIGFIDEVPDVEGRVRNGLFGG